MISYDPFDAFDTFFFFMLLQMEQINRRMRFIRTLSIVIPLIIAGVVSAIILITLYRKGHIGGAKKSVGGYSGLTSMDRIARRVEKPLSKEERMDAELQKLGYECKYCKGPLKSETCGYCGRTNFKLR
ncbi:MAG: hypothetical protein HWN67_19440 [Candidatus Helarchaeota archaeon]|nr:hypothetical protein [Candidatus Helarchaeota archaeon]